MVCIQRMENQEVGARGRLPPGNNLRSGIALPADPWTCPGVRGDGCPLNKGAPIRVALTVNSRWPPIASDSACWGNGKNGLEADLRRCDMPCGRGAISAGTRGPHPPFAARHDAAPRFPESAVHARRSNPTLERSALRTKQTCAGAAKFMPPATDQLANESHRRAAIQRDLPIADARGGLDGLHQIRSPSTGWRPTHSPFRLGEGAIRMAHLPSTCPHSCHRSVALDS